MTPLYKWHLYLAKVVPGVFGCCFACPPLISVHAYWAAGVLALYALGCAIVFFSAPSGPEEPWP